MKYVTPELKRSKYRLLGLIGQGQFGKVFCAIHRKTGRIVALKSLDHQRFPTHKFLRELRFLLSLQHDNIVNCQALEHTRTGRYLVLDYCEGGTLRNLMEAEDCLRPADGLALIANILSGLAHAHSRGIVHCDIKPENILLRLKPAGWTACISDFGIARLSQELTDDTGNTGSPAYMAPERFYGQYSCSSDLYAVGIMLFELLMGDRPFSGSPSSLMSAHLNLPVKIPIEMPAPLQTVILTALQKLPARRYHSAADMLNAVQSAVSHPDVRAWIESNPLKPSLSRLGLTSPIAAFGSCHQEPLRAPIFGLATNAQPVNTASKPLESLHDQGSWLYKAAKTPHEWQVGVSASISPEQIALPTQGLAQQPIYQRSEALHTAPENLQKTHVDLFPTELALALANATGPKSVSLLDELTLVEQPAALTVAEPIQELTVRSQGCFVLTQRSIYLLPSDRLTVPSFAPRLLAAFEQRFISTIEAQGRWLVTAKMNSSATSELTIWQLPRFEQSSVQEMHPVGSVVRQVHQPFKLLALDSRHFMIASGVALTGNSVALRAVDSVGQEHRQALPSTRFEFYTRRGNLMSYWNLSISVRTVIASCVPYRLVATEQDNPNSLLLIDLKPFKVLRVAVAIEPVLLAATAWGYILADRYGQIVLLDEEGRQVGRIAQPEALQTSSNNSKVDASRATAIATFKNYGILLATWNSAESQGNLYTMDLRKLNVDLLF